MQSIASYTHKKALSCYATLSSNYFTAVSITGPIRTCARVHFDIRSYNLRIPLFGCSLMKGFRFMFQRRNLLCAVGGTRWRTSPPAPQLLSPGIPMLGFFASTGSCRSLVHLAIASTSDAWPSPVSPIPCGLSLRVDENTKVHTARFASYSYRVLIVRFLHPCDP